jgi:hypothetical protein
VRRLAQPAQAARSASLQQHGYLSSAARRVKSRVVV